MFRINNSSLSLVGVEGYRDFAPTTSVLYAGADKLAPLVKIDFLFDGELIELGDPVAVGKYYNYKLPGSWNWDLGSIDIQSFIEVSSAVEAGADKFWVDPGSNEVYFYSLGSIDQVQIEISATTQSYLNSTGKWIIDLPDPNITVDKITENGVTLSNWEITDGAIVLNETSPQSIAALSSIVAEPEFIGSIAAFFLETSWIDHIDWMGRSFTLANDPNSVQLGEFIWQGQGNFGIALIFTDLAVSPVAAQDLPYISTVGKL